MIEYFAGDERPSWEATITVAGVAEDLSSGHTFEVVIATRPAGIFTKTTGITGGADGVVTVDWEPDDLALTPGDYLAQLTVTRTSDSKEWTVEETIRVKRRLS